MMDLNAGHVHRDWSWPEVDGESVVSERDRWSSRVTQEGLVLAPEIQLAAFRALHIVTKQVHSSLDLTATLDAVAQGVVDGAGFGAAVVNLARSDGAFVVVSVAGDQDARDTLMGSVGTADKWAHELARSEPLGNLRFIDGRRSPMTGQLVTWTPDLPVSEDEDLWHPRDALLAPLSASSGEWVGVLSVDLPFHGRRPDPWQLEILELFADHAAIAIQHAGLHSALREQEAQARYAASHDALTGLSNRAVLLRAEQPIPDAGNERAVLLIDLDGFKKINDTRGHEAGDEVLRTVAHRLRDLVPDADIIARIGGDEFVVVISGPRVIGSAQSAAARIGAEIGRPIQGRFGTYQVGASIGLALATTPVPLSELLARADAAMYAQKRGRAEADVG
jgi:diguanylate cyclase (GGDEF)-like protein